MNTQPQRILVIEGEAGLPEDVLRLLRRGRHEVLRVRDAVEVPAYLEACGYEFMLIIDPLADCRMDRLLLDLRRRVSPARFPATLILAPSYRLEWLQGLTDAAVSVAAFDGDPRQLSSDLARFLTQVSRSAKRLSVQLTAIVTKGRILRVAQTENLSLSGALLRGDLPIPLDSLVQVRFELPGGAMVCAEGKVVRIENGLSGAPVAIAVAFTAYARSSFDLLGTYLDEIDRRSGIWHDAVRRWDARRSLGTQDRGFEVTAGLPA